MTQWYYSDYQRNRHGPVPAAALAELHAHGQLAADTLVWREGMDQWRPWHQVMDEVVPSPQRPTPATIGTAAVGTATVAADAPAEAAANPYAIAEPRAAAEARSPYAPPSAALADGGTHVAGGEVVYAGFWKRVAASVIDSLVVGVVSQIVQMLVMGAFFGINAMSPMASQDALAGGMIGAFAVMYLLAIAINVAYFAWFHASARQATLGKMAVGIKVVDAHGHRITFARGVGRYFAYVLSSLTFGIGLVMAAFTDRKRALHDMIASTLVVDQWAYTEYPERQRHELGTVTVVILALAGLMFAFLIVAVIAAIAIAASAAG